MADAFGLGTVGWSPLGGGLLTGKYRRGETGRAQGLGRVIHGESDARKTAVLDGVLAIAEEVGATPGQVAIAWVLGKGILPIIGPRTPEQLADNLAAAFERVEAIRRGVAELAIPLPRRPEAVHLTISAGIAVYGADGTSAEDLLGQADDRLFAAKEAGRNRVVGLPPGLVASA